MVFAINEISVLASSKRTEYELCGSGNFIKNVSGAERNKMGYCMWILIEGIFCFVVQMNLWPFSLALI